MESSYSAEQDLRLPAYRVGQKIRLVGGHDTTGGYVVGYVIDEQEGRLMYRVVLGNAYRFPQGVIESC